MTRPAIQAALLVDLVIAGAISNGSSSLFVDTSPMGFGPADRLLVAVAAEPDRTVESWLRRGPVTIHDMIDVLVRRQVWRREPGLLRRTYRDTSPSTAESGWSRVLAALDGQTTDEATAAVAVIGAQSGLFNFAAPPSVEAAVAATGSIGWIVGDLSEYLHDLRDFWAAAAAGSSGGGG